MKTKDIAIIAIASLLCVGSAWGQSFNQRYVKSKVIKKSESDFSAIGSLRTDEMDEAITYLDVLNRSAQSVVMHATPNSKDFIQFSEYNIQGQQEKLYLPYATTSDNGEYRSDPISEQAQFYVNAVKVSHTGYAYSEVKLDDSPLAKVEETSSPGYSWRMENGKTNKYNTFYNSTNEVRLWTIESNNTVSSSGFYDANTLVGAKIQDENRNQSTKGKETITYIDKSGKTILKKEILDETKSLLTYYVYDEFGDLRFIIPPKASATIPTSGSWNSSDYQSDPTDLIFWNKYDSKHRVKEKKTPGKEVEYFVYDKLDRVIMRQDGNLRNSDQWYFYKYDILGRLVIEGILTDDQMTFPDFQAESDASTAVPWEEKCYESSCGEDYTDQSYPNITGTGATSYVYIYYYYDKYPAFITSDQNFSFLTRSGFYKQDEVPFDRLIGKITAIKVRTLEATPQWLTTVSYFDQKGNVIQSISKNHLGGYDINCNTYYFDGKLDKALVLHNYNRSSSTQDISIQYRYEYDNGNRVTNIYQQYCPSCDELLMSNFKYNEVGQLIEKNLHKPYNARAFLQSVDYSYNPRGWLTGINRANLTNNNIYIQNEVNLDEEEKIDGMVIDTILMGIVKTDDGRGNYGVDLTIDDKKYLRVTEIGNPSNSRIIDADEHITDSYLQSEPSEQDVYSQLEGFHGTNLEFLLGQIYFEENSDVEELLDSLSTMVKNQLPSQGITDSTTKCTIAEIVRSFISAKVGIVYFNEDNTDLFGMDIKYETGPTPQYNGNISSVIWQSKENNPGQRRYDYNYDRKNRLLGAEYAFFENNSWSGSNQNGRYDVSNLEYDDNGNIIHLYRNGAQSLDNGQYTWGQMDALTYDYNGGNKLDDVTDGAPSYQEYDMPDFHEYSWASSGEYTYDDNGNMITDANKGITSIVYNHLNLPVEITFGTQQKIIYLYDAAGRKLTKKVVVNSIQQSKTDYNGPFIYNDGTLTMINTPEGRIVKDGTTYEPQYFLKDYLGNVRVVIESDENFLPVVVQEDHYYPYGMKLAGLSYTSSNENKYLYQGKEFQDDLVDNNDGSSGGQIYLNWYDFDARYFDPQLARWHVPDPLNQYASPYVGMGNNPISLIDPSGLAAQFHWDGSNKFWYTNDQTGKIEYGGDPLAGRDEDMAAQYWDPFRAMDEAIAKFDAHDRYLEDWYLSREEARLAAEENERWKHRNDPPPDVKTDEEIAKEEGDPGAETDAMITNASSTGLSYSDGNDKEEIRGVLGVGIQGTLCGGIGGTAGMAIVMDEDGNTCFLLNYGIATGGEASVTLGPTLSIGNNLSVNDLQGTSVQGSGGISPWHIGGTLGTNIERGAVSDAYGTQSINLNVGGSIGGGASVQIIHTIVIPLQNQFDLWFSRWRGR